MPATAIVVNNELIKDAAPHRVYLKQAWSDEWTEVPYLYCDWCIKTAAPSIGSAQLSWRYGDGMRQLERQFGKVQKLDYLRFWVKIEIGQPEDLDLVVWAGTINEDGRRPDGAFVGRTPVRVPGGQQAFLAYDLSEILNRQKIASAWIEYGSDDERRIGRGLVFNRPNQGADCGNRGAAKGPQDVYLFADDVTDASYCAYWSSRDIVEYLLVYQKPESSDGFFTDVPIEIDQDALDDHAVPEWDRPIVQTEGRSLKSILDELLDRRRLLSYTVELDTDEDDNERILLRPFTFLTEPLLLPSGEIVPKNPTQISIDFDQQTDLERPRVQRSAVQHYDQVEAVGDRVLCVGTFSYQDSNLEAGWSGAQQAAYEAAASGTVAYLAAADKDIKQAMNADARGADSLARVFAYLNLPDDWDGKVNDGAAMVALFPWDEFPELDQDVDAAWYLPDLRLERQLPLKTDHDYSGSKIADDDVDDDTPTGRTWEYRRPYVVIRCPDRGVSIYCEVDRLAGSGHIEMKGAGAGRDWACTVRTQEDAPGLVLRVSGRPQHVLAGPSFTPLPVDEYQGDFDWQYIQATLALRSDQRVTKSYPAQPAAGLDIARILRIDASRRAKIEYVAAGTIVGCDAAGLLEITTEAGFVRDDREDLEDLARIAWGWYGGFRQTIELCYRQAVEDYSVGDLVVEIGKAETLEQVQTVITEIRWDLAATAQQTHRTTIKTQWAELDPLALVAAPTASET